MSKNTLIRISGLILMAVSFVAYISGATAFPIASENLLPWSVWFTLSVVVNMIMWFPVMKLVSFSLGVILFYSFIGGLMPESTSAGGAVTELDWDDPDAVAEIGEVIFNTKGQCSACHTLDSSAPQGRCPDLTDIGLNAANREPGVDAKTYLIESLYEPSKYLVPGYGKIMPEIWKNPIGLSRLEIAAVIAFLQNQGGEIDPEPFPEPIDRADIGTAAEALPPLLTGDPEMGEKVFVDQACISCHVISGLENPNAGDTNEDFEVVTAPELSEIAAFNEVRYIEESILLPHEEIVSGYGAVTVNANGGTYQGTLVSQDTDKIVVRTKEVDGTEQEHTILFSEFDDEPIEELVNLQERGFFTLTLTPMDSDTPVSGEIVEESVDTVTLKAGDSTQTISKDSVKKQFRGLIDDEEVLGEYISGDLDSEEIVIMVDGSEESYDPFFDFDVESTMFILGSGKKLKVTSPMPDNFPILLTVADKANLLAYLSTLTGQTEEETSTAETTEDTNEEAAE